MQIPADQYDDQTVYNVQFSVNEQGDETVTVRLRYITDPDDPTIFTSIVQAWLDEAEQFGKDLQMILVSHRHQYKSSLDLIDALDLA